MSPTRRAHEALSSSHRPNKENTALCLCIQRAQWRPRRMRHPVQIGDKWTILRFVSRWTSTKRSSQPIQRCEWTTGDGANRASLRRSPRSRDPHTAVDWLGGRHVASSAVNRKEKRSVAWSFSGYSDRPAQSCRLSDVPFEEQRPSLSTWPTPERDHSDRCAAQAHANTHTHARGSFVL